MPPIPAVLKSVRCSVHVQNALRSFWQSPMCLSDSVELTRRREHDDAYCQTKINADVSVYSMSKSQAEETMMRCLSIQCRFSVEFTRRWEHDDVSCQTTILEGRTDILV
jgi:hypothetical protein